MIVGNALNPGQPALDTLGNGIRLNNCRVFQ